MGNPDQDVRRRAAKGLREIGPEAELAVPVLIQALDDSDDSLCFGATKALGQIGPKAKKAIPALRELVKKPDGKIRRVALNALNNILTNA